MFHRLSASEILVPPLRARRSNIGLLFAHFALEALGEGALADQTLEKDPWLSGTLAGKLIRFDWPGNVRQLRNVARRLASIAERGGRVGKEDLAKLRMRAGFEPGPVVTRSEDHAAAAASIAFEDIDDDRLLKTLREHAFELSRSAKALGISRSGLDALIAKSTRLKKAKDLTQGEIDAAIQAADGDIDEAAAALKVSARGLKLRMTQLGLFVRAASGSPPSMRRC